MTTTISIAKAETAILNFVSEVLLSWPEWIAAALTEMRSSLEQIATRVPERIVADERRLAQLSKQVTNLVDSLADGTVKSPAITGRLASVEAEAETLRKEIEESRSLLANPARIPDDAWISEQLNAMGAVLRDDERWTAILLRKFFGRITAHQVIPSGKKRGYPRLRFRIDGWEILRVVLDGKVSDTVLGLLIQEDQGDSGRSGEFQIDLGGPSRMDDWGPKIAEMRAQGIPWKDIWEITGLGSGPAYVAWKRYVDSQKPNVDDPDGSTSSAAKDRPDAA